MRYGLILVFLLLPLTSMADIYQWVDEKGVVHYRDTPVPGAQMVNLEDSAITTTSNNNPPVEKQQEQDAAAQVAKIKAVKTGYYSSVSIVQPQNEATFFDNHGEVVLTIAVKPDIREEDQVVVLLDGQQTPAVRNAMLVKIENVERGMHKVQVQIRDAQGKGLAASNIISFMMRRPAVQNPIQALQKPALPLK